MSKHIRRPLQTLVCLIDSDNLGPFEVINPDCRNAGHHTPEPMGYIERQEWTRTQLKTRDCSRCPECGLWVIWTGVPA